MHSETQYNPLLNQLKELIELDRLLFFQKTAENYHQRALKLQELGLDFLAIVDFKTYLSLEKKENLKDFDYQYVAKLSINAFMQQYQAEKDTPYYAWMIYLVSANQKLLLDGISSKILTNISGSLALVGLFNLSLTCCDLAIQYIQEPNQKNLTLLNKGLLLNLLGDFKQGLPLYEKRLAANKHFKGDIYAPHKKWNGEDIGDQILLIRREQGIGDNIQFVRYAIMLKQQGINVVVCNKKEIDDFLRFNLAKYNIPCSNELRDKTAHYTIWMMSLPYIFKQNANNIPFTTAYLQAKEENVDKWRKQLPHTYKRKIGFVFQGNKEVHKNKTRGIDLSIFKALFKFDAEFICLQKELDQDEKQQLDCFENVFYPNQLNSFFDTSAIIAECDLVISVDTSVAHLAAAMGKSTWILVNYVPDFRWGLHSDKSIWYKSVKLFRQDLSYTWQPVIDQVYRELERI